MTKVTLIIAAGLLAISAPAFAGGKSETKGNKINAQAMAGVAPTGFAGYPGASVARDLGKSLPYPKGGWGNVGSALSGGVVAKPNPKGL